MEHLPDIAISIGTNWDNVDCQTEGRDQLFVLTYPYENSLPLLADAETDYKFPQWSPDGEWLAYVASKPISTTIFDDSPLAVAGTDSVWIIRPDGSEARKISADVPSAVYTSSDGCLTTSFIDRPPVWSPDGKYVVFTHFSYSEAYRYYLAEVRSGKTRLLLGSQFDAGNSPLWASGHHWIAIQGKDHTVNIVKIAEEGGEDEVVTILPPPEVPTDTFLVLPLASYDPEQTGSPTLVGIFSKEGNRLKNTYIYLSAWDVNAETGQWTKIADLNKEANTYPPVLGNHWTSFCMANSIDVLDIQTWKTVSHFTIPQDQFVECRQFRIFQDDDGSDVVSFQGAYNFGIDGIWVMKLTNGKIDPQLGVPGDLFLYNQYIYIDSYSWRP